MLVAVGDRMDANKERGSASSGEGYPFCGPTFVLTHEHLRMSGHVAIILDAA
jgi:hypothetical protein